MVDIDKIKEALKEYLIKQFDEIGKSSVSVRLMKPVAKRAINNNIDSFDKFLKPIADKDGKIDIEGIFDEEMEIIDSIDDFNFNLPFIGEGNISKGIVSLNMPYLDKSIAFNRADFETLKELIIQ